MSPPVEPVASDPTLPKRTDVVIVGGGIIGVTTALFLAEKGIAVALCEKGRIAGEQSSRNWGWCRTMGRDPSEIPLAMESLRLWRDMNRRTNRETGFRQSGIMYLLQNESEIAAQTAWSDQARQYQVDARLLRGPALDRAMPGATNGFIAGLHTPTDGKAEPALAAPAIAEAARDQGAEIFTNTAVRGIDITAGRVSGVVTERGRIACQSVVLAGGAWSRLFAGNAGLDLPQLKVLGSVFRTKPLSGPEISAGGSVFAFRKRMDGGYSIARRNANTAEITPDHFRLITDFIPRLIHSRKEIRLRIGGRFWEELRTARSWTLDQPTPFEAVRVLDPKPKQTILAEARTVLSKAFPAFANMQVEESWAGWMDVTPDAVPVIDQVGHIPGFYIATGFSGHGFGIGPGAGRLTADLVAGDTPVVDPTPFRLARFRRTQAA
ncbi:FAD-binding oxidoreductase [Acidisphaera sp. S103]|uniref:NAD(P)/FAD-dependent oxidoreductase n=1 Tax=Acidisphaera sp. S103 TaxID=1747223 RepID=UPI00131E1263|nr:FAD-binding oxidoreductase [Acidisphaera sp. S103]